MRKFLIFIFLFVTLICKAQHSHYDLRVDTVTYNYYLAGDWNKLIDSSKLAIKENIDFKFLRQRMGYAYFVKGDYYASKCEYEKALTFDPTDITTQTYLYYCGLYTNNEVYARYRGGLLNNELKKSFGLKPFKILNSLDLEYNYKVNDNSARGNQNYIRGGIDSELGYRINLYQTFSTYTQNNHASHLDTSGLIEVLVNDSSAIRQNEYFALLDWTLASHLSLDIGYHYLQTKIYNRNIYGYKLNNKQYTTIKDSTLNLGGNMLFSKLTYTLNRFDFAASASVLRFDNVLTQQYGIYAGVLLPGKQNIYLKSSLYGMIDSNSNNRLIFSQSAGALFFKKLWVEGCITLGNLNNFSDNNGLYIYNSLDPTTFRTGLSLFWNMLPNISLFGNYTYDKKLIEENNNNYNQHSFSSGIIWKL